MTNLRTLTRSISLSTKTGAEIARVYGSDGKLYGFAHKGGSFTSPDAPLNLKIAGLIANPAMRTGPATKTSRRRVAEMARQFRLGEL